MAYNFKRKPAKQTNYPKSATGKAEKNTEREREGRRIEIARRKIYLCVDCAQMMII